MKKTFIALLAGLVAAGTLLAAGTTGSLSGEVKSNNEALPGVTVTASSPAQIGGARTTRTDERGVFSFPRLAPGVYTVRFELDSFVTQERTDVEVRLEHDTELHVAMSGGEFGEQVVVTADTPVVDTEQTDVSETYTDDYLQKVSVGSTNRSYLNLFEQTAGVLSSGGNGIVFGSTIGENAILFDGSNTTDPVTSTFGAQLNFDSIEEVSVHKAGSSAEFRAVGGVLNVVTKSGGNDFSGSLDARYRDTGFTESGDHFDPGANQNEQGDFTGTLGGPVRRDELWFFAAAELFDAERTDGQEPVPTKIDARNNLAKLTWSPGDSWEASVKWSEDPADFEDIFFNNFDAIEAAGFQEQGGSIFQGIVTGVFGANAIWDLNGQVMHQKLNVFPSRGDLDTPAILDLDTGAYSNNYPNAQFSDRDRDELRSSFTYFLDGALGSHELKAGAEYSDLSFSASNNTPGGILYRDRSSEGGVFTLFRSSVDPAEEFSGAVAGGYLQDAWRITPRVTLRLGVRYDEAAYDDNLEEEVASLGKVQPRLGLAWDLFGNGKTVARLAAGRFMDPNALTLPSFARVDDSMPAEVWVSCSWTEAFRGLPVEDCEDVLGPLFHDPLARDAAGWWLAGFLGGSEGRIDPNLDATYADHLVIGLERELFDRTSIELSYVDKDTNDIFEDTCNGNVPVPTEGAACDFYLMTNLPGLTRTYKGATLEFETRHWSWLHLRAFYTYSETKGNVEYTQNAGTDADVFPVHFVNRFGYLSTDRRHVANVTGFVRLPLDFGLGFDGRFLSAFPYDLTRVAEPYGEEFLAPRGSFRANDNYQLDLQLTKDFKLGDYRLQVIASVLNALDSERPLAVCERSEGCGNAEHGDPLVFQRPRAYEAGIRFTF